MSPLFAALMPAWIVGWSAGTWMVVAAWHSTAAVQPARPGKSETQWNRRNGACFLPATDECGAHPELSVIAAGGTAGNRCRGSSFPVGRGVVKIQNSPGGWFRVPRASGERRGFGASTGLKRIPHAVKRGHFGRLGGTGWTRGFPGFFPARVVVMPGNCFVERIPCGVRRWRKRTRGPSTAERDSEKRIALLRSG